MKNGEWIKWGIGIIVTFLCLALPFMGNAIIANDKEGRARDEKISSDVVKGQQEQQKVNQEILVALKEIQTDLKYLKKNQDKYERPN